MSGNPENIFDLLSARAGSPEGDEPAVHWQDHTLTWNQVERCARKVAGSLLHLGVQPGDRVAAMLPNVPPFIYLQYATHLVGAIFVPVNELTRAQELGYLLEDCEPRVLFAWGDYHDIVDAAIEQNEGLVHRVDVGATDSDPNDIVTWRDSVDPYDGDPVGGGDDIAMIRYTAGVTGRPKGAKITHANVIYAARETDQALRILDKDTVFGAMPFYHPFGSTLQLQMLLVSGTDLNISTHFDAERVLAIIRDHQVSVLIGLPMHFAALVDAAGEEEGIGKLRFAVCGGGPLDMGVLARFERIFHTRIATIYGTCEASPTVAVNPAHRSETPRDALGRVISGTTVRIVDEANREQAVGEIGEIAIRGPGVFHGYWNRPNATTLVMDAEGWFHTSDLGRLDIDGWLYGVGRLHDRINKGGFSVYPREVEQVLAAHPSVHACAVIGIPDRQLGEEIVAYVVPRSGMTVDEKEVIDYCSELLARYKAPKQVVVVESLPRSPGGVVLRRTLREKWVNKGR